MLMHSSNRLPLGNCDSSGLETCLNYLTRSGTVSNRSSPPSSLFRVTDTRERARGTGEFCLAKSLDLVQRSRVNQPDPTFPRLPGIIFEISGAILFAAIPLGSFNELETS